LEPLNREETDFIRNVDEGLAFLEKVRHPAVGLLLDTYHVNKEEASSVEAFRTALAAGKLFHVHLGDSQRKYPGSGSIDFAAIVTVLIEGGYRGYLSAELLPWPDGDTAAQKTLEFMRTLVPAA
jgi:sugar phosphate isomerase/epimerase